MGLDNCWKVLLFISWNVSYHIHNSLFSNLNWFHLKGISGTLRKVLIFVGVYVVYVFMYVGGYEHTCVGGGKRSTSCVFLNSILPYFMGQDLSLALEVTDWAKVTAGELQGAIYPSMSPLTMPHELKLQTYTSAPGLFVCGGVLGSKTQALVLACQALYWCGHLFGPNINSLCQNQSWCLHSAGQNWGALPPAWLALLLCSTFPFHSVLAAAPLGVRERSTLRPCCPITILFTDFMPLPGWREPWLYHEAQNL